MSEIREYFQIIIWVVGTAVAGLIWLIIAAGIAWRIEDRGGLAATQRRS